MSLLKKMVIGGALAVGIGTLFNELAQEKPGGGVPPVWGPTVQPQAPREYPPATPVYPPAQQGQGLSGAHMETMNRCLQATRSLASPMVPQDVMRDAVYGVNRILVEAGTELIPYHVNVVCENMVAGLSIAASGLLPGQCSVKEYSFAAVDEGKKFAVELCRDDNVSARETRVRLGQGGVRLVP